MEDIAIAGVDGAVAGHYIGDKLFGEKNRGLNAILALILFASFICLIVLIGIPWLIISKRSKIKEYPVTMISAIILVVLFYSSIVIFAVFPAFPSSPTVAMILGATFVVDSLIFLGAVVILGIRRIVNRKTRSKTRPARH